MPAWSPGSSAARTRYSPWKGLSFAEVEDRLETYGENSVIKEQRMTFFKRLWENVRNPLVILLTVLGLVFLLYQGRSWFVCYRCDGSTGHRVALCSGK